MNKDQVIENMIAFVEETEKNLQASNVSTESKSSKNEVVNSILNRLEKEVQNEN